MGLLSALRKNNRIDDRYPANKLIRLHSYQDNVKFGEFFPPQLPIFGACGGRGSAARKKSHGVAPPEKKPRVTQPGNKPRLSGNFRQKAAIALPAPFKRPDPVFAGVWPFSIVIFRVPDDRRNQVLPELCKAWPLLLHGPLYQASGPLVFPLLFL